MDKYLSIITNFGCHYKCPYCIVKQNNLQIPKTTLEGLRELDKAYKECGCNIISISGGGDPLHNYDKHFDWYRELFKWSREYHSKHNLCYSNPVPIEMHTSYMTNETSFPFYDCYRVVYHANTIEDLNKIHRTGKEIVRVVYVITKDFTLENIMDITNYVQNSEQIDELSFRQFVDDKYEAKFYLHDYLKLGHKKLWWYIEQNDYNLYYVENEIYTEYRKIGEKVCS